MAYEDSAAGVLAVNEDTVTSSQLSRLESPVVLQRRIPQSFSNLAKKEWFSGWIVNYINRTDPRKIKKQVNTFRRIIYDQLDTTKRNNTASIDIEKTVEISTLGEVEQNMIFRLPPKKELSIKAKIIFEGKAKPNFIIPEEFKEALDGIE